MTPQLCINIPSLIFNKTVNGRLAAVSYLFFSRGQGRPPFAFVPEKKNRSAVHFVCRRVTSPRSLKPNFPSRNLFGIEVRNHNYSPNAKQ